MVRWHPRSGIRVDRPNGGLAIRALSVALIVTAAFAARADTSDPDALYKLAEKYERADGVVRDSARALTLYCRAARAGSWKAAFNVGWMRLSGAGTDGDNQTGAGWFRAAPQPGQEHPAKWVRIVPRSGPPTLDRCSRTSVPGTTARMLAAPPEILAIVTDLAPRFDVEPRLVLSMIAVESSFRVDAVSPKKARGLMQLMPQTAARFGVANSFDPRQNIEGGMKYLRWLLDYFEDDKVLALAAYNAGEQAVRKHGGIPPYAETRSYVEKVLRLYERAQEASKIGAPVALLSPAGTQAEAGQRIPASAIKPRRWTAVPHACYMITANKTVRPC